MTTWTSQQEADFKRLSIPYVCLEPAELEIYDAALCKLGHGLCLEWGAGYSTIYFPSQHPDLEWIAIEHNPVWRDLLKGRLPINASLRFFPDETGYVFDVFDDGVKLDFISVDGKDEWRGYCMLAASILLKPGTGRCFLHDTARREYRRWFGVFDHAEKLADGLTAEQNPHGSAGRGIYQFWNDAR